MFEKSIRDHKASSSSVGQTQGMSKPLGDMLLSYPVHVTPTLIGLVSLSAYLNCYVHTSLSAILLTDTFLTLSNRLPCPCRVITVPSRIDRYHVHLITVQVSVKVFSFPEFTCQIGKTVCKR